MARGKKKESALTPEEKLAQALVPVEEQPYQVPENWCWARIGAISDFERGITFPASAKENEPTEENIPCLRTANVQENLEIDDLIYVNQSFMKGNEAKLVRENDIIMSSANSRELVGKASFVTHVPFPMTFGGFVLNIRARGISSKYLFYFLRQEFLAGKFMGESTQTTNIANINTTTLGSYELPLPPLAEQQRIVDRIEYLFAKLDEAKEKAQSVLDSFETRKAAILHKAFTGQLKIDNEELSIEDWEDTTIGECCRLGSGGTPSKSHPEYYENGDIPWLKTGEIDWNDIYDVEERITNEGVENSSAKIFPAESVVVAMYGMGVTRGKAAILKMPTATNQAVCVLQPNEKLNNRFLFYYFMCNYWQIRERSVGGNQLNLSGKIIASFPIKLPPLNFQLSIVNFLDTVLEKESRAKEAAQTVLDQIALLKKSILARAFRGEL